MSVRAMSWIMVAAVALAAAPGLAQTKKVKIVVMGDSLCSQPQPSWPEVMVKHLGEGYSQQTFAAGGLSTFTNTYKSIWTRYEHVNAAKARGDITLVALGANDAKTGNWPRKREWPGLYKKVLGMYKGEGRKVYVVLPPPCRADEVYGISRDFMQNGLIPAMREAAKETGCEVIDINTPLLERPDATCSDGLYLSETGCEIVGALVAKALTGKDYPMPAAPKKLSAEEKAKEAAAQDAAKAVKTPAVKQMNVGDVAELTPQIVQNEKGDGPDGKGNTSDDTWQFWLELQVPRNTYHHLVLNTKTMSAQDREKGVTDPTRRRGAGRIRGPVAAALPNPKDTEGWIFVQDWDARFEGVWGDLKANRILMHPYVEKNIPGGLAISFRVPADGTYEVSGKLTDLQVMGEPGDGIEWRIELAHEWTGDTSPEAYARVAKGGPFGDKVGPASGDITGSFEAKKADLIRLVLDPRKNWGAELTALEGFKIKRVK
ncbi:MAG: GDSL-type esterase/lipase family protein [Planctomycetaceae bacterium]|nr:GDSL-type esterase/lipase family protein [Planctomycetaceae bacterium]